MRGLRIFERLRRLDTPISPRAAANGAGYLSCGAPNGEPSPFTMALECAAAFRSEFARLSM